MALQVLLTALVLACAPSGDGDADLIVLDRNLFDVPIEDVSDTTVELTLYQGEIVHEK